MQTIKKGLIHPEGEMTPGTGDQGLSGEILCDVMPIITLPDSGFYNLNFIYIYSLEQFLKSTKEAMIHFQIFPPILPALFFFNSVQNEH